MKVIKILGFTLAGLIVLVLVLGLVAPKEYAAERTMAIDAPREIVFEQVRLWDNWHKWSPWSERDSLMGITVGGTDGEEGSTYEWVGDPEITGSGKMTNTGIKLNEEIAYHLHFLAPMESESEGYLRLSTEGEHTIAAWGFSGVMPFPWNVMLLFMDMEAEIAPDFDRGLTLLKELSEQEAKKILAYNIQVVNFPATRYAAVKGTIAMKDMKTFFSDSYGKIQKAMKKKYAKMRGYPAGLYFTWDEKEMVSEMAVAMPVNKSIEMDPVTTIEIPAQKAFLIDYYGPYDGSEYAHKAHDYNLKKLGLTLKDLVLEEYVTDPGTEPDPNKWLTKIYYFAE